MSENLNNLIYINKIIVKSFKFIPDEYGKSLNFFSWKDRKLIQTVDLGEEGTAPLEIRFLHDPKASQGFVGCALHANIFR